jgi:hypothetical protein
MKLLQVLVALAAGTGGLAIMPSAAEPVYRYCMVGTPNSFRSCTFSTLAQCQMTASGGAGFCQENNAYVAARGAAVIRR